MTTFDVVAAVAIDFAYLGKRFENVKKRVLCAISPQNLKCLYGQKKLFGFGISRMLR